MTETAKDFYTDARRRQQKMRIAMAVVGGCALAGVGVLVASEGKKRSDAIAESGAAAGIEKLAGPPCPTMTAEEFAPQAAKARKTFQFNGDTYARRFGHLDCNLVAVKGVKDPAAVCQFTGPQVLQVVTAKGTFHFKPGAGQPATIRVVDEIPSCVMASNFR